MQTFIYHFILDKEENCRIFAILYKSTRQGTCLFSWQAFLCLLRYSIRRFRTPVWSVNAPTAWLVKSNGKGGTALIS